MAGFGGKGKRDAPKGRSTAPSSMIGAVGLIARGDRAVPVTVQTRTPVAPAPGQMTVIMGHHAFRRERQSRLGGGGSCPLNCPLTRVLWVPLMPLRRNQGLSISAVYAVLMARREQPPKDPVCDV
jgi:hypothetical protein